MFKYIQALTRHAGRIWLLVTFLVIGACVSQPQKPAETARSIIDADDAAFQQAEDLLGRGQSKEALGYYSRYLSQYANGRHAPQAFLRIGTIYQQHGELGAAEAFYRGAIEKFPQSHEASQAHLALIDLLIQANRSAEAGEVATAMLGQPLDQTLRHDLLQRLVKLSSSTKDSAHTALYSYLLYTSLPSPENASWHKLLIETIASLDEKDIISLWDRLEAPEIRGYMMYRYAEVQAIAENDDDALDVLSVFRARFPDHPYSVQAQQLLEILEQRLSFEPRTIGCLLPLSGAYEAYGQRALNAIQMALSQQKGTENQQIIKLVVKDSASNDERAVAAVRELSQARVGAIIGPMVTAPAATREAQQLHIPMVTLTQKPEITTGDFIFRHFITPHNQVKTLVQYFVHDLGLRDFAVMYPKEAYGKTFMMLFWDEIIRQGGRMMGVESYSPEQTDFAETIKRLTGNYYPIPSDLKARPVVQVKEPSYFFGNRPSADSLEGLIPDPVPRLTGLYFEDSDQERNRAANLGRRISQEVKEPIVDFDVLFIPDAPKTSGLILPQLAYYDVKNIYLAGTNLWHSQQLIDMTGDYAQSAIMVDGFYKDSQSDTVRRFVEGYRSIYGTDPGLMEAFAFDTANFLFELIMRPEIQKRNELRDAMKQLCFIDGVTGATAFAPDGEAIKRLSLLRIKGNRFVEIEHP